MSDEIAWSARMGAHLEASRKRAGLRRPQLAARLGVSEETIRLWEKGAVQPSAERLARLIALLALETSDWPAPGGPDPELPPFARRLRGEREGRGITQVVAAELLDVPQATYAGWETGRSTPSIHFFPSLAQFLGVPEPEVAELYASPFVVDCADWPPFGQLLGTRRQKLRLTRPALAEAVGVAPTTVVAWELGYRQPAPAQLEGLAEALKVRRTALAEALPARRATTGLGELILGRQRELGLRSADVAKLVGASETTVSRWINGKSRPAAKNLNRLAEVLKLPVKDVVEAAEAA